MKTREERRKHGQFPSKDVDLATALQLFEWSHYRFARSTEALPPETTQRVLAALVEKVPRDPAVLFLQSAATPWREAVNALKVFGSQYAWGSKPFRQKLQAIARNPQLLAATRAAAVGASEVPDAYLAVLALDGADESVDALLPHFDRAMREPARLDSLESIAGFARQTPALGALMAQVKQRLEQRRAECATHALAQQLGLASGRRFRVDVALESVAEGTKLEIRLDDTAGRDYRVWLHSEAGRTAFDTLGLIEDGLQLGRCALPELPYWLAVAAQRLGVRWQRENLSSSYLKGQRLDAYLAWLLGPSKPQAR